MKTEHQEIECRFLGIDKLALVTKLLELGATDEGEVMLEETIAYDRDLKWLNEQRLVRLRKSGDKIFLTYKEHRTQELGGAYEVELTVNDFSQVEIFLGKIGLLPYRHQQKKRHTLKLNNVIFDIDTWPKIPAYVELEGDSENALKLAAQQVGLDWKEAEFHDARWVIENKYSIPVGKLRWFTFDRIE